MKLIKQALIVDSNSKHNNTRKDILIDDASIIVGIENNIENEKAHIISDVNLHVSNGWLDLKANFCTPGNEYKETIESGANAAITGGFTTVVLSANTNPTIQSKAQIEYIKNASNQLPINLLPMGAATLNMQGQQMAELFDMHFAGAVAFGDDKNSIKNTQLLTTLMQYANNFGAKIFHFANDYYLSNGTIGHEGVNATSIGFKGQPAIAEDVIIARDIAIAKYYNLPIHFSTISTSGAVQLIRNAKNDGINVSCDVAAHQLYFTDKDISNFDSNLKVLPPFRDEEHRQALINGLADGTIDAICSDHSPENIEGKDVEFNYAAYGISSIEHTFALANTVLKSKMSIVDIVNKFTINPATIINTNISKIEVGAQANLTLFNPTQTFVVDKSTMKSNSKNTPLHGIELVGKVIGVVC